MSHILAFVTAEDIEKVLIRLAVQYPEAFTIEQVRAIERACRKIRTRLKEKPEAQKKE